MLRESKNFNPVYGPRTPNKLPPAPMAISCSFDDLGGGEGPGRAYRIEIYRKCREINLHNNEHFL